MASRGRPRKETRLPLWLKGVTGPGPEPEEDEEVMMEISGPPALRAPRGVDFNAMNRMVERLGPGRDPRVMLRDLRTMMRSINDPRVIGAPQDVVQRFAQHFLGTVSEVMWPHWHGVVIMTRACLEKLGVDVERVIAIIPDVQWGVVMGVLRPLAPGRTPDTAYPAFNMEVLLIVASDFHLYGCDVGEHGDGSVFKLCDDLDEIFTKGPSRLRSLYYNYPYEWKFESSTYTSYIVEEPVIKVLAQCHLGVETTIHNAYGAAGYMKKAPWGGRAIIFTNPWHCPDMLEDLPREFIDRSLRPAGFIIVGMCHFEGGRVVMLNVKMPGVYHLLDDNKVVCMAENLRAYLRGMRDSVKEEKVSGVYYHPSSPWKCALGRRYRLPPSVPYETPHMDVAAIALNTGPLTEEQSRNVAQVVRDEIARCGATPRSAMPQLGAAAAASPR